MSKDKVTIDLTKLAMGFLLIVLMTHTTIHYSYKIKNYYLDIGKTQEKTRRIKRGLWRAQAQALNYKHEEKRREYLHKRIKENPFKVTYALLSGDQY